MRSWFVFSSILGVVLMLVACSGDKSQDSESNQDAASSEPKAQLAAQETQAEENAPEATRTPTDDAASPEDPKTSAAFLEAKQIFETRCATCHGITGKGDGPAGVSLPDKPRNYQDAEWQATVTDEELAAIIVGGGAAVGKSVFMVPNPDLKDKPEVVAELIRTIRGFQLPGE